MLTGGADKTARLYDMASETVTATMKGHKKKVSSVILHPTADVAVTGSADKTVCIWEASTGKKQHTLKVRGARFVVVAFVVSSPTHPLVTGRQGASLYASVDVVSRTPTSPVTQHRPTPLNHYSTSAAPCACRCCCCHYPCCCCSL